MRFLYQFLVQIDRSIMKTLDEEDISTILTYCTDAFKRYWKFDFFEILLYGYPINTFVDIFKGG